MANIKNVSGTVFDSILPVYGNPRKNIPVWNEDDKMFISSEYESQSGNRYYKGLRFTERLAIVETIGLYHTWKYIDNVEVYTFNGKDKVLIGSKKFDKTFYDQSLIHSEVDKILRQYVRGQMKLQNIPYDEVQVNKECQQYVDDSYTSFLSDEFNVRLQKLLPILGA